MKPVILLSFDVEEFDMPLEYNCPLPLEEQMQIGKRGLDAINPILQEVTTTLFTTANFADHYPDHIHQLSSTHEIASHTYYHSNFDNAHLLSSKLRLEAICNKPVVGLRMPRMRKVSMEAVKAAGYEYDSSINPTYLPGRYNNFHLPRRVYMDEGMKRIPASVSPLMRIPLFWLSFKNMPYALFLQLCLQTLQKDGYICLYFHPWEFTNIQGYQLPGYTTRWCGIALLDRLQKLIKDLQKEAEFIPMRALTL